jgi:hypothetical protein
LEVVCKAKKLLHPFYRSGKGPVKEGLQLLRVRLDALRRNDVTKVFEFRFKERALAKFTNKRFAGHDFHDFLEVQKMIRIRVR